MRVVEPERAALEVQSVENDVEGIWRLGGAVDEGGPAEDRAGPGLDHVGSGTRDVEGDRGDVETGVRAVDGLVEPTGGGRSGDRHRAGGRVGLER